MRMKKISLLLATLLAAGAASVAFAQEQEGHKKMSLDIWVGYTTVSMSDVNNNLDTIATGLGSVTKMNNGFTVAGDFLFEVAPKLAIGPRVEYVYVSEGKIDSPLIQFKENLYLIPVMIGGRYNFVESSTTIVSFGLFGGWGFGYGQSQTTLPIISSVETTTKFDGSAFAGEALIGAQFNLGHNVYFGLDAGYRLAKIPEMDVSSTSLSTSGGGGGGGGLYAPSKAPVLDTSGNKLAYDFSGAVINIGISFKF